VHFLVVGPHRSTYSLLRLGIDHAFAEIHALAEAMVEERKQKRRELNASASSTDLCYLVDLLIDSQSEGHETLTDEEIRDNAIFFLIAGSETTATVRIVFLSICHSIFHRSFQTMSWFFAHTLQNLTIWNKVVAEVDQALPNLPSSGESDPIFTDGKSFAYLMQCVHEALRISPPISMLFPREFPEARTFFGYLFPARVRTNLFYADCLIHSVFL